MTMDLEVLKCGNCEPLKLGVHGMALGLATLCGLYNAAAWLTRRDRHLAVNAVLYAALIAFEQRHVAHHIAEIRQPRAKGGAADSPPAPTMTEVAPVLAVAAAALVTSEIAA